MNINKYKNIGYNKSYFLSNNYLFHAPFLIDSKYKRSTYIWNRRKYFFISIIPEFELYTLSRDIVLSKLNVYGSNVGKK